MNREDVIHFNMEKKRQFQVAWETAVVNGEDQFDFDGHPFLTSYAKYLVEHLNNTLLGD
jgi:hypothetical protein